MLFGEYASAHPGVWTENRMSLSLASQCTFCRPLQCEDTYTLVRQEAVWSSTQPSVCNPEFLQSDSSRGPSEHFVKRSSVLFFVSTCPTDSLTHDCMAKQRISMCMRLLVLVSGVYDVLNLSPSQDELKVLL